MAPAHNPVWEIVASPESSCEYVPAHVYGNSVVAIMGDIALPGINEVITRNPVGAAVGAVPDHCVPIRVSDYIDAPDCIHRHPPGSAAIHGVRHIRPGGEGVEGLPILRGHGEPQREHNGSLPDLSECSEHGVLSDFILAEIEELGYGVITPVDAATQCSEENEEGRRLARTRQKP